MVSRRGQGGPTLAHVLRNSAYANWICWPGFGLGFCMSFFLRYKVTQSTDPGLNIEGTFEPMSIDGAKWLGYIALVGIMLKGMLRLVGSSGDCQEQRPVVKHQRHRGPRSFDFPVGLYMYHTCIHC